MTLYTKEGCSLCRGVKASLEELRHEYEFVLEEIDITSDVDLYERYREIIPVVTVDGSNTLASRITEDDLRRALSFRGARKRSWWAAILQRKGQ